MTMKQNKLDHINNSGFKVPKDYFSQVEEHILNDVSLKAKTETSGFEVPDSYFDAVEQKILDNVVHKNDPKVVTLFPWKKLAYTTAIAASLILMFNIFLKPKETITWNDIETASIEDYLEDAEISSFELASLLTDDELTTNNFTDNEIPEGSIEDYLLENVDLENLMIEQ